MKLYKAQGTHAFTLYAETENGVYCEIHFGNGKTSDVSELDDSWPIGRVKAQFDLEPIEESELPDNSNLIETVKG